jgi:hypothetical protein
MHDHQRCLPANFGLFGWIEPEWSTSLCDPATFFSYCQITFGTKTEQQAKTDINFQFSINLLFNNLLNHIWIGLSPPLFILSITITGIQMSLLTKYQCLFCFQCIQNLPTKFASSFLFNIKFNLYHLASSSWPRHLSIGTCTNLSNYLVGPSEPMPQRIRIHAIRHIDNFAI